MTGDFDQQGMEPERGEVVTLGFGRLLGLLFVLLLVCGLCFGAGYFVGHRGVKAAAAAASASGNEPQPLPANQSTPGASASAVDPFGVAANGPDPSPQGSAPSAPSAGKASAKPLTPPPAKRSQAVSAPSPRSVVQQQSQSDANAHSAPAPTGPFMVQVAAVANPDDAEVLVNALRKLKYPVTAQHGTADNLIHVRMGPFSTRAEADEWRTLLSNDGYSAVVQQ